MNRISQFVSVLFLAAGFASDSSAQLTPQVSRPVRSINRWLGVGWSNGYHWRNSGPNSDYYQPYSDFGADLTASVPDRGSFSINHSSFNAYPRPRQGNLVDGKKSSSAKPHDALNNKAERVRANDWPFESNRSEQSRIADPSANRTAAASQSPNHLSPFIKR